jgi:CDP-paratose 2-epimerase
MPPLAADRAELTASRRVLVTGGAGFIGSNVAVGLARRWPRWTLVALDNLRRRGSEMNIARLREVEVQFVHGDIRVLDDVLAAGEFDAVVDCSAESSVLAGGDYVVQANLVGAYHCLELARRCGAQIVFLSTSRVYPVKTLAALGYVDAGSRFELDPEQAIVGASESGIAEDFPLEGARTLYGATKLAAELLIEEYRATYGIQAVINRCGVVAGPWQMGKSDQGVFAYWMLAHRFDRPLNYIGFGGSGKQVRDLLHVDDLLDLVDRQLAAPATWDGVTVNVGGGRACSLSLIEATALCAEISGRAVTVGSSPGNRPGDIPIYLSDCTRLFALTDWRPRRGTREILTDIHSWIVGHEAALAATL